MDVLVVVGNESPPSRLEAKARHIERTGADTEVAALLGGLRARIPRRVGVWGPVDQAAVLAGELHQAGLPVELFTDEAVPPSLTARLHGVDVRPVADPGAPMQVADSV